MQHDHVLKKLNFDLLSTQGGLNQAFVLKSSLICFIFIVRTSVCMRNLNIRGRLNFNYCHAYLQALGNHDLQ